MSLKNSSLDTFTPPNLTHNIVIREVNPNRTQDYEHKPLRNHWGKKLKSMKHWK